MIVGAMLLVAAGAGAPAVLEPTSKWQVDYGETGCMLGRTFGSDKERVVIGWRSLPLDETMELIVRIDSPSKSFRLSAVQVALNPGAAKDYPLESYPTRVPGKRVLRAMVDQTQFEGLASRVVMTVTPHAQPSIAMALTNASVGFRALQACSADLLKGWKIDDVAEKNAISKAVPLRKGNVPIDLHFPDGAIDNGEQGRVYVIFAVGTDGRASDCRTIVTSGFDTLDRSVCDQVTRTARYRPATGPDGRPMVTHKTLSVQFRAGNAWAEDSVYKAIVAQRNAELDDR